VSVVVDTSVWSLALRRRRSSAAPEVNELGALVREGRASIIGAIRQELLSGMASEEQFQTLRDYLRPFPDVELEMDDYEEAASFLNRCRSRGIQGSNTDFLICAVAVRRQLAVLTTDDDFAHFARVLPIQLHSPRKQGAR
jgi:predicted nucleic acid-binding protein